MPETQHALPVGGIGLRLFRSLRSRNFRLFFFGQAISLIGTWMQATAIAWLVWRLSLSPMLLGIVGFVSQAPSFVVTPFAGVVIDRINRHHVVILTQFFSMLQALTLAVLMFTGWLEIWHIIVLSLCMGIINAVDVPARQSFIVQMIDHREDLTNAIALNSSMFNGARLIGPAIAGFIIAWAGEGVCFLVNGLSYIAVLGGLLIMRVPKYVKPVQKPAVLEHLREGFRYAFGFPPVRTLLFLLALVSMTGASYSQLLPIFAQDILHGDSRAQGFLVSSVAVGALTGALYLAGRRSVLGLGRVIPIAAMVLGFGLIGLGLSENFWLTLLVMPAIGLGLMMQMASTNTLIQTMVDDDKRGRVMSLYAMAFMGTMPLGSLLAGTLAHYIGAPMVVILGGICCILGALVFLRKLPALRVLARPVYVERGILKS